MENKMIYPAGFFEEEEPQKPAKMTNIPIKVAITIINAEEDEFDGLDDQTILSNWIQKADFLMRVLDELMNLQTLPPTIIV